MITKETRTLVVTGASSGIGKCISEEQLKLGRRIIGLGRNFPQGLHQTNSFVKIELDLSDLDRSATRLATLSKEYPEVTDVICSAGRGHFGSLEQFSYSDIRSLIDLNFTSQAYVIRAFLPILKRNGHGNIIIIGSEAALLGGARGGIYSASKSALRGLAQSLRAESATSGIRVTMINPGMVRTRFFEPLDFKHGDDPNNFIEPLDIAQAVGAALDARQGTVFDEINLTPLKKVVRKKTSK